MRYSRLAVIGGVVALGLLCWLAAIGMPAITEILVTVFALVVLVGGGNWLSSGHPARPPAAPPGQPGPAAAAGSAATGAAAAAGSSATGPGAAAAGSSDVDTGADGDEPGSAS